MNGRMRKCRWWLQRLARGVVIAGAAGVLLNAQTQRQEERENARGQARSMVITRYGMVVASQALAAQAGAQVLEAGGNAIDAAIAANAVMGVVEPEGDGLGGDLFAIYYDATSGKYHGLNASGWTPRGLSATLLKAKGFDTMPNDGIHSVTVPGAVAGWEVLRTRFGTMPYSKLLASAIAYAQEGFPVTEWIAQDWERNAAKLLRDPYAQATYLPDRKPLTVGQVFRNTDLAHSLRLIAASGPEAFYQGPIAAAILKRSQELGGTMEASDFTEYTPQWVEPISSSYRGWTVTEMPPNNIGLVVLSMLNIMEQFPLGDYGPGSARALHVMIEAKKLAFSDMIRRVGDPAFSAIPVAQLISKTYARQRAASIDPGSATCAALPLEDAEIAKLAGSDTIYLTVVDKAGNQVSFLQSNFALFGSGLVAPGTGFVLQNRAGLFSLESRHPNELLPRKRSLHTLVPGFLSKGGTRISFGFVGGFNQAQASAQFVANVADHGMNVQKALEFPRFTKNNFEGCDVTLEQPVEPAVVAELRRLGHDVRLTGPVSSSVGAGQAIMHNEEGVNFGGSDPRRDGSAVPEPPHVFSATHEH